MKMTRRGFLGTGLACAAAAAAGQGGAPSGRELWPLPAAPRAEGLGVPKWVAALSLVASLAALLVMGCLLFNLVEESRHATGAGANEMAFLEF